MNRMRWAAVALVGLAGTGVACSGSGYSTDDFQQDLEDKIDLSPEVASCVADGVDDAGIDVAEFDSDKPIEDLLDPDEQELFTEVITTCVMTDQGIDPDDVPNPADLTVPD